MKLKVAIVDDHPLFSDGLKYYLSSTDDIYKIQLYSNGKEFLDAASMGLDIDLVFMDVYMPVKNGIETTKELKECKPDVKVIAISSLESVEHVEAMITAGADGYLLKSSSISEIETAISEVRKGNSYFSANIICQLSKRNVRRTIDTVQVVNKISEREMEVLKLICSGYDKYKIGEILCISERTVDKHRENILEKTGCENVIQLMIFSIKNNLITLNM